MRQQLSARALVCALALPVTASAASFNPDISLILEGRFADFEQDPEQYELPGFARGSHTGPGEEGFSLGHSELVLSGTADDLFFAKLTAALHTHEGETDVELEEAFIETLGLGSGLTVKAGRFFSGVGYLNEHHPHAWDFADAPLVYAGLFGGQLNDDGIQLRWVAPTDIFLQLGAEFGRGENFPAGGAADDGSGTAALFAKIGGDVGPSHSWQLGVSRWHADVDGRTGGGHSHGGATETPSFTGESDIAGIDFVWKWAPNGNASERNLKLQAEYFERDETGDVALIGSSPLEQSSYDGTQSGWYTQAVYQFMPRWRVGLRYDRLKADNRGSDADVLGEAGLDNEGHTPRRTGIMVDYSHSEFSRLRLQFNRDRSSAASDDQIMLQYIVSLGAHGAHKF